MIWSKIPSLRPNKRQQFWAGIAALSGLVMFLIVIALGREPESMVCLSYAILSSLFLIAQVVGFVVSQTRYSDSVEEAKFRMLESEEEEWAK